MDVTRGDELLGEERIPVRAFEHLVRQSGLRYPAQDSRQLLDQFALIEARKVDPFEPR